MPTAPDDPALRDVLRAASTVAVVGLSANPQRASHDVAAYLQRAGYRIVPVNPTLPAGSTVLGEPVFARLEDVPFAVDIVDAFRRAEDIPAVAISAVAIRAKCLWQQLGIASAEGDRIARAGGLVSVMDLCLKVEHARLGVARS
jgi:uncharacterized protein